MESKTAVNEWKTPEIEEIPLSCEIATYSNAELPN
jgi:coenzyme PQQ precursor peptide PqqA